MTELSIALKAAKFVPCHQGKDRIAGSICAIEVGTPFTFDFNNGIAAIYDEKGHVWVLPERLFTDALAIMLFRSRYHSRWEYHGNAMKRGCYVPHSNDGGAWAKEKFPK
jgi:hypothetical protein